MPLGREDYSSDSAPRRPFSFDLNVCDAYRLNRFGRGQTIDR